MWLEFEEYDELTLRELRLTHTHINSNGIIQFLILIVGKNPLCEIIQIKTLQQFINKVHAA